MKGLWIAMLVTACGNNVAAHVDAGTLDARVVDAQPIDAAPDAAQMVRIFGNVNYNGGLDGCTVMVLGNSPQSTFTDSNGDFHFDVYDGAMVIMEVVPPMSAAAQGAMPMIRGVIAHDHIRPRVFYLLGTSDVDAAASLNKTFDPAKAIVETDFRNVTVGGYSATLNSINPPGFGIVYDDSNPQQPQLGTATVAGGDGSTLLLGDVPVGSTSFTQTGPTTCQPCDAEPLPLLAGVTTWFDFECGTAMCM